MAGLIVISPDDEAVGVSTGDDVAVNTFLDIYTDTLYFTDAENIYEWEGDTTTGGPLRQVYTWRSGEIRMPNPVNMGAAIVEAETYLDQINVVAGDLFWSDVVFASSWEGTNGATTDTEDARSVAGTFNATAQIGNAQAALGSTSLQLNTGLDYVQYGSVQADYDAYQMASTSDFTIDGFVWLDNQIALEGEQAIIGSATTGARNFEVSISKAGVTPDLELMMGPTTRVKADLPSDLTLDTWYYFLIQRRYNAGTPQVDFYFGLASGPTVPLVATVAYSENPETVNAPLTLGATVNRTNGSVVNHWDGFLDAVRVTKALRAGSSPPSTFTVPTTYYSNLGSEGTTYDITFRLYADGVLKHTQIVANNEPFRLPGGYLSNIYSVEIESAIPVTRVSVAENIFELSEG